MDLVRLDRGDAELVCGGGRFPDDPCNLYHQTESSGDGQYLELDNSIEPGPCRGILFFRHRDPELYCTVHILRLSEGLAAKSIGDEINWSSHAGLDRVFGYFILAP